jgi:endonuclease/exonuclease/phosphatase family metal-dependent hydrolase
MNSNHIDCLRISETKTTNKNSKHIYKQHQDFVAYFNNDNNTTMGTGVGILLSKQLAKYVQKVTKHKGRVIYIDLFLKGKIKLRIIQIYLHANTTGIQQEIKNLYEYIFILLKNSQKNHFKIILMGDFNINYEKYLSMYHSRGSHNWRYDIFNKLETYNLTETISFFHNITPSKPYHNFFPKSSNKSPSRIDYIWISQDLILESINSELYEIDTFNTDHKAIYLNLFPYNLIGNKQYATLRQQQMKKTIFHYDKMTKDEWDDYGNYVDELSQDIFPTLISNTADLNRCWDSIQKCIKDAAKEKIWNSTSIIQNKEKKPQNLTEINGEIRKINKIIRDFNKKNFNLLNIKIIQNHWKQTTEILRNFAKKHKHDLNLPPSIDNKTIETFRIQIKAFLKILMVKCDILNESYKNQQIKEYVRKRCEDFKDNPSHMINSLIDCQKRKIVIDRVLINNKNNQELLVDPVQIKEATVHHFQTCAGGTNIRKEIPQQWQQQYSPKSNINPDIYNTLMDPPSLNEWYNIIKNLPNDKAAGPSGITNEMFKHLGEKSSLIIFNIICACIKLNDIPSAWREANIYPIPKPKDWNSELSNTRPITLLETIRKAMVRIINDRLMKIMVEHKILKGNQFAALPGSSTFEPIRIINETIEDAKEQKKEIWLLFQDLSKAYDRVNIFMLEKAFKRLRLPSNFITLILNLFSNRKNRVFTAAGTTDLFDMLIGIDQGEVISPPLWCIYYDPLLCEIEERKLGYNIKHTYKQNLYSDQITQIEQHLSVLAFMDDTSWITESKQNLELILSIADGFYQLNNIMVNKQKSELLVKIPNNKDIYNNEVSLNFGNEQIKIQPKKYTESIRILGIWMNLGKKRNFIIQQAKDEVLELCNIMKKKLITDKQLLYIYNTINFSHQKGM